MRAMVRGLKAFLPVTMMSLAGTAAVAAEYGIGISAKSDSGLIYVPVNLSPAFRIEPYFRLSSSSSKQTVDFGFGESTFSSEFDQVEGGLGFFGLATPKESVRLYYGGRASYYDSDTRSASDRVQFKQSAYGYRLTPTIGFEYLFNSHFTLGGEIGYYFENRTVDDRNETTHRESESDVTGTESFLVLRYFF